MEKETLSKLETVVQKMLGNIDQLKKENSSLNSQLQEKLLKIDELENRISAVTSDQNDISTRVSSLIESIEEWESIYDVDTPESVLEAKLPSTAGANSVPKKESSLFEIGD
nr:cell division protein ZapB [Desulfobulbaceae bacterium]